MFPAWIKALAIGFLALDAYISYCRVAEVRKELQELRSVTLDLLFDRR